MRRIVAVVVAMVVPCVQAARADDHVLTASQVEARFAGAARARAGDLARVDALLALPESRMAASRLGVDVDGLRQGVAQLSDAELHDLAARVRALQEDPVSGSPFPSVSGRTIAVLLLLAVALVAGAVLLVKSQLE